MTEAAEILIAHAAPLTGPDVKIKNSTRKLNFKFK
jgi:hypothetical protein